MREEICADSDNPTPDEEKTASSIAQQRYLAVAFLRAADKGRYGLLVENIEKEFFRNRNRTSKVGTYPVTVTEAYEYLDNYNKTELKKMIGNPTSTRGRMSFH